MKKEIEFDFAKWGQEDVIALDQDGNDVLNIIELKQPINGWVLIVEINGKSPMCINRIGMNQNGGITIKMFEEVKPREFWVNVYENGTIGPLWSCKKLANNRLLKDDNMGGKGQTIKVMEVLD